jgi:hypothetical protein
MTYSVPLNSPVLVGYTRWKSPLDANAAEVGMNQLSPMLPSARAGTGNTATKSYNGPVFPDTNRIKKIFDPRVPSEAGTYTQQYAFESTGLIAQASIVSKSLLTMVKMDEELPESTSTE